MMCQDAVKLTSNQKAIVEILKEKYPGRTEFRRKDLDLAAKKVGVSSGVVLGIVQKSEKVARGLYAMDAMILPFRDKPASVAPAPAPVAPEAPAPVTGIQTLSSAQAYVPTKNTAFVRWGNYSDVERIVKSGQFYPTFITGLSGNGKTLMVEQVCANLGREIVRLQITPETSEDDLIGGFRLVNGDTVFVKGPVLKAMESGAILLIDELDRGTNKILALQGVMEGKPVLVKKTGEVVSPVSGFNVIATGNTKGNGSEDGRFAAATILDEAFLERFVITIEQPYPSPAVEKKIIVKHMELYDGEVDEEFADILTLWGDTIRKTYEDGGVDDIVTTRRICHIVQTNSIFGDRKKAIELCLNRFDNATKEAFVDLYTKVDASVSEKPTADPSEGEVDKLVTSMLEGNPYSSNNPFYSP